MIEVKDLNFAYQGVKKDTLKNINFRIGKGEIFGFLGPSGAGKSTVQKILIGILKNYRGSVNVFGKEIKYVDSNYFERIGVGFEVPTLHTKLTAYENLKIFKGFYNREKEDIDELLELVGLEKARNLKGSQLSKGMKMRLNFCRALINKPELIFLDEPTSGLDPVNSKNIRDIITQKKEEGKTIFITTHNMSVAEEICDRIAFIIDGTIKLIDSPRNLKLSNGKKSISVEYRENHTLSRKEFPLENLGFNKEYIKLIQNKNIERITTEEATLEDIFISVTGRRLS